MRILPIREKGIESLSPAEQRQFVKENIGVLVHGWVDKGLVSKRSPLNYAAFDTMDNESITRYFRNIVSTIVERERKTIYDRLDRMVKDYLKERGIPFDEGSLNSVRNLKYQHIWENPRAQIDWPGIEFEYIDSSDVGRRILLENATDKNWLMRKWVGNRRLTPQQKKRVQKWFEREYPDFLAKNSEDRQQSIYLFHKRDYAGYSETINKLREERERLLRERFEREVLSTFVVREKKGKLIVKTVKPVKQGTREQRMEEHLRERKQERVRAQEIKKINKEVQITGRQFAVADYVLNQIRVESPKTASVLQDLLNRKLLRQGTLASLFTSGSLAQRVFMQTVTQTNFIQEFGEKRIETVARWIAMIGSRGVRIDRALKSFNIRESREMYTFLEKNGIIETHHGGGEVVYLHRPQTAQ